MSEETPRLGLPLIAAGQAQKELFHNEALDVVDALLHGAVEEPPRDAPPPAPLPGQAWIVGPAPVAAWADHAGAVAWWSDGGWRFMAARDGMTLWVRSVGCRAEHGPDGWLIGTIAATSLTIGGVAVVGMQRPAIADPAGGAGADAEARRALAAVLAALRNHGLIAT